MRSARFFLPRNMIVFTSRCTMRLLYTGSGMVSRRATAPFLGMTAPRLLLLGPLGPVLRASLAPVGHTGGIDRAADDVISDAGQVGHAAAADEDDRVLLEVVADAGDVGGNLVLVRQPHAGDLPQRRVRLLGGHRLDRDAAPPPLRVPLQVRRLALGAHGGSPATHQLVDCRHLVLPPNVECSPGPTRSVSRHILSLRPSPRAGIMGAMPQRVAAPGYRCSNLFSCAAPYATPEDRCPAAHMRATVQQTPRVNPESAPERAPVSPRPVRSYYSADYPSPAGGLRSAGAAAP